MIKEINFITIGDKNFFHMIHFSIKQLMKFYPNCKFYIYDWGFTPFQKETIKSYPITILIEWTDKINKEIGKETIITSYKGYTPNKDVRTHEYLLNQKPFCMFDCAKRINNNLIFLDGDATLINKIDEILEDNFDLGVTLRRKDEIEKAKKMGIIGAVNSGVIFFKLDSKRLQLFIEAWINEIKTTKTVWLEQAALNNLIQRDNQGIFNRFYNDGVIKLSNIEIKVKTFPCELYNFYQIEEGYSDKVVKILHFKGRWKKHRINEMMTEIKFRHFYFNFLKLFPSKISNYIENIFRVNLLAKLIHYPLNIKWIKINLFTIIAKIRDDIYKRKKPNKRLK